MEFISSVSLQTMRVHHLAAASRFMSEVSFSISSLICLSVGFAFDAFLKYSSDI
jgi:hypothetical protein